MTCTALHHPASSPQHSCFLLHVSSVEIPTADARTSIRFMVVPTGPAQQAIVVEAVADGSSAAQAGVQRGMKLTGISDPVRRNEVWQLQVRTAVLSSSGVCLLQPSVSFITHLSNCWWSRNTANTSMQRQDLHLRAFVAANMATLGLYNTLALASSMHSSKHRSQHKPLSLPRLPRLRRSVVPCHAVPIATG